VLLVRKLWYRYPHCAQFTYIYVKLNSRLS
jgi:hypothetical protein